MTHTFCLLGNLPRPVPGWQFDFYPACSQEPFTAVEALGPSFCNTCVSLTSGHWGALRNGILLPLNKIDVRSSHYVTVISTTQLITLSILLLEFCNCHVLAGLCWGSPTYAVLLSEVLDSGGVGKECGKTIPPGGDEKKGLKTGKQRDMTRRHGEQRIDWIFQTWVF